MKLNYITFMVRDIKKSVDFYRGLVGLSDVRRISLDGGEIVFLANCEGDTMIELIELDGAKKVSTQGMVLSFQADEKLELLREKAVRLGYSPSEIIELGAKPKHFTVADPDDITIEFSV